MAELQSAEVWKKPFADQLDYFHGKLNLPTMRWDDIQGSAHDRAFVVAGVSKADMLQDFADAVDRAIQGGSLDAFRKDFAKIVQRTGWDYNGSFDWRTRVIYQTNLASSYAAGRWKQLTEPDFAKAWPYWRYVHSDAVATPRPLHLSWNGITLPMNDPWWRTHFAPNGWGCNCRIVAVGKREYDAAPSDRKTTPSDGSYIHVDALGAQHEIPNGIDYGFSHAPGANVEQTFSSLIHEKLIRWDARIGSAAFDEMREVLTPALTQEFSEWADSINNAQGQMRVVGALSNEVVTKLAEEGVAPQSAHIAVRDIDVLHTHRDVKSDVLPWEWYREMPAHLAQPQAVILDRSKQTPALLYVFKVEAETRKLVVRLDYEVAVRDADGNKQRERFNILRTGRPMNPQALNDPVTYELLQGSLAE